MSAEARAPCTTARCFARGRLVRRGRGGIFSPVIHGYLQPDEFFLHRSIHHAPFGGSEVRAGSWACRVGALSRSLCCCVVWDNTDLGTAGPIPWVPKTFWGFKASGQRARPLPLGKPEHGRPRPHGGLEGPGILRLYSHFGFFATVFCAFAHLPCTHIPTALPHTSTRVTPMPLGGGVPEPLGPRQPLSSVTATPASRRDPAPPRRRLRPEEALGCGLRGLPQRPHFSRSEAPALFASGQAGLGAAWAKGHHVPGGDRGGAGRTMPSTYGPLIPTQPLALEAAAAHGGAGQDPAPAPGSVTRLQPRRRSAARLPGCDARVGMGKAAGPQGLCVPESPVQLTAERRCFPALPHGRNQLSPSASQKSPSASG